MTDIFKGGAYRLLFMAFNFGVGLLIAYLSGVDLFGTISLLVVNAGIFLIVSGLGMDSAIIWYGAKEKISQERLAGFSFFIIIFQLILFIIASFSWWQFFQQSMLSSSSHSDALVLEFIYFLGLILVEKYTALLYARQHAVMANKIMATVLCLVFMFLLVFYFELADWKTDPFLLFTCIPLAQVIPLVWFYHSGNILRLIFPGKEFFSSFLSFSFIVFITNTVQYLAYRVDYWVLLYFYSTAELGVYAQANRFAQLQWIIPNIAASLIIPAMAAQRPRLTNREFLSLVKIICVIGLVITLISIAIAQFLFTYFLPVEFMPGFRALVLMLPGFYFFILNILLAAWFAAHRKLWTNFYGSLICLVAIVIADLILIPRYSFNGAAIGNSIAYSLAAFYSLFMFVKLSSFRVKDLVHVSMNDWKTITEYYGRQA